MSITLKKFNMDYGKEFKSYYTKHLGKSSSHLDNFENSMTPYVLEERELRVTQIDIFSRMMMDRIIWLAGPVNDRMSTVVQAQLMFLDNCESTSGEKHQTTAVTPLVRTQTTPVLLESE